MVSEAPAINDPKIERMVSEINKLIEAAIDEDGDPIGVIDTSNTWQEPYVYKPIEYKNGALKLTSYSLYNQNKPEIDIIKNEIKEYISLLSKDKQEQAKEIIRNFGTLKTISDYGNLKDKICK
jgi:hypothetical protein